jgi:hypothetical protein
MESFTFLFGSPAWLIVILLLAGCLIAVEGPYRLGRYETQVRGDAATMSGEHPKRDHLGAVQAVLASLLGLLLAFSMSMAVTRFENRKAAVVEETNCIGTAYLRVTLLPERERGQAETLFKEYTDTRLQLARPDWFLGSASEAREQVSSLQRQIWAIGVKAAESDQRAVTTGLFISAVNEMIDSAGRRDAGLKNHVPESVVYVIIAAALACLGIMGYSSGLNGARSITATIIITVVVVAVIFIILDFDRPYRGLITISQQGLLELRQSMDLGLPLP